MNITRKWIKTYRSSHTKNISKRQENQQKQNTEIVGTL